MIIKAGHKTIDFTIRREIRRENLVSFDSIGIDNYFYGVIVKYNRLMPVYSAEAMLLSVWGIHVTK